jgi:hypothetical protein
MPEPGERVGLAPEPGDGLTDEHLVIDVGQLHQLDGNRLARGQVPAAPDLAHGSAAERDLKLVSPD